MILLLSAVAFASGIEPRCIGENPVPYYEQVQVDFLQNYIALAGTLSPIHGPIPHAPGTGAVGLDLNVIPPLTCARRFALNASKTEKTNKMPVLPRPRVTMALPLWGDWIGFAGFAYVPPLQVAGQRSTIVSGEVGVGLPLSDALQVGGRVHTTAMKTIADAASAIDPDAEPADDLYLANTYGLDVMVARPIGGITPYAALGITDVSTYFWVGDDGVMSNNMHPYFGPVASLGTDGLIGNVRWGAELYAAPGGHSRPDRSFPNEVGFGGYGHLYTGRIRVAFELGAPDKGSVEP